ncbi:MAG: hypothetical protein KGI08_00340 [Thaumarchaeota archaeon]|nr:hypothetical protein [Nitrososphaerota archaeon]
MKNSAAQELQKLSWAKQKKGKSKAEVSAMMKKISIKGVRARKHANNTKKG